MNEPPRPRFVPNQDYYPKAPASPGQIPLQPSPPAPPAPPQKRHVFLGLFIVVCLIAAIVFVVSIFTSGGGGTTYSASAGRTDVINPATLAVVIHVTNTGKAAGTPTCTINAQDPGDNYTGVDEATLQGSVAAGDTTTFIDQLTITKQGAQYVTSVTVSCR